MRILPRGNKFVHQSWKLKELTVFMNNDPLKNAENMKSVHETFGYYYAKQVNSEFIIMTFKNHHMKDMGQVLGIFEQIKDAKYKR